MNEKNSILAVGGATGQLCIIDLANLKLIYSETNFIPSELTFLQFQNSHDGEPAKLYTLNLDQNLFVHEVMQRETNQKQKLVLTKSLSRCFYLDEVIDLKFFKPDNKFALMCSNSETLKLLNLSTGTIELYN